METASVLTKDNSSREFRLKDVFNREFKDLRISLTDRCNMACVYCVDPDDVPQTARDSAPPEVFAEIVEKLHSMLKLKKVRLTGGEPLLYPKLEDLVIRLKDMGIPEINMTTNALLLEKKVPVLKRAGINRLNISLDAVDEEIYQKISRRKNLSPILRGIEAARDAGLQIRLNCTLYPGVNENQIWPVLHYACSQGLVLRYLELMNMGHLYQESENQESGGRKPITRDFILNEIRKHCLIEEERRTPNSTANYWWTMDGYKFGIIANTSTPFCRDCNRLRLDSRGRLIGCLSSSLGIQTQDILYDDEKMTDALQKCMDQKQTNSFRGSELSMRAVGG